MKTITSNTKFVLLQPPLYKQGSFTTSTPHHRLWLLAFISFLTIASLLAVLATTSTISTTTTTLSTIITTAAAPHLPTPLPSYVADTLIHFASVSNVSGRMSDADIRLAASVIRRRAPCNLLIFGLGPETPLWRALNTGGRTVFLDENEYYIAHVEGRHPGLEAYDVGYTTKVRDLRELLAVAGEKVGTDCRPVQNLLFSDCRLAVNDLPNALYDVAWDVIMVDGPRGYDGGSPGRMAAVFTAAVMARTRNAGPTEVMVHDYEREVERVCSEEFLCEENLVASTEQLAHFVVRREGGGGSAGGFCATNRTATAAAAAAT